MPPKPDPRVTQLGLPFRLNLIGIRLTGCAQTLHWQGYADTDGKLRQFPQLTRLTDAAWLRSAMRSNFRTVCRLDAECSQARGIPVLNVVSRHTCLKMDHAAGKKWAMLINRQWCGRHNLDRFGCAKISSGNHGRPGFFSGIAAAVSGTVDRQYARASAAADSLTKSGKISQGRVVLLHRSKIGRAWIGTMRELGLNPLSFRNLLTGPASSAH